MPESNYGQSYLLAENGAREDDPPFSRGIPIRESHG